MQQYSLGSVKVKREQPPIVMGSWLDLLTLSRKASQWVLMLFWGVVVMFSTGTSAAFTEDTAFPTQVVESGQWIPELSVLVDGQKKPEASYAAVPCVTFETDIEPVNMYYSWSGEGLLEDGTYYTGGCIAFPEKEGEFTVYALAAHDRDNRWQSDGATMRVVIELPEEKKKQSSDDEKRGDDKDEADETTSSTSAAVLPVVSETQEILDEVPTDISEVQHEIPEAVYDGTVASETSEESEIVTEEKEVSGQAQSKEEPGEASSEALPESNEILSGAVE